MGQNWSGAAPSDRLDPAPAGRGSTTPAAAGRPRSRRPLPSGTRSPPTRPGAMRPTVRAPPSLPLARRPQLRHGGLPPSTGAVVARRPPAPPFPAYPGPGPAAPPGTPLRPAAPPRRRAAPAPPPGRRPRARRRPDYPHRTRGPPRPHPAAGKPAPMPVGHAAPPTAAHPRPGATPAPRHRPQAPHPGRRRAKLPRKLTVTRVAAMRSRQFAEGSVRAFHRAATATAPTARASPPSPTPR
jgi:hypothetical protein